MRYYFLIGGFAVLSMLAGLVVGQERETIGLKGLKVPLEYYPDGSLKALLKSEVSTVDSSGQKIKGEVIRYETYTQGGATDVVMTADECYYDKANGNAKSDSNVKLVKDSIVITGKGFELDAKKEMISLHTNVVVEFTRTQGVKEKK